jgi:3-oxoacyl-[acyl-carrier protein] reductase
MSGSMGVPPPVVDEAARFREGRSMPPMVLVTGAARGIGQAIAEKYAAAGWKVLTPGRKEMDLASAASVEAWLRQNPLKVDALVNNAGENWIEPLAEVSLDTWERCLAVNLTAPVLLAQAAAPHMRAQRWGRIVNISSIFGLISRANRGPYTAAKTGLVGFTRAAAIEWGPDNVLVNAVCPGFIETDLTRQNNTPEQILEMCKAVPLGRLGQPEEIARAVFFLGSGQNTYITGQTLVVDGGFILQ